MIHVHSQLTINKKKYIYIPSAKFYLFLEGSNMSAQKKLLSNRGCRQVKDISIETYTSPENNANTSLLNPEVSKKSSKSKKAENISKVAVNIQSNEKTKNNVVDLRMEPITFVSGNPFVEVTKGILHLYKEEYVYLFTILRPLYFVFTYY